MRGPGKNLKLGARGGEVTMPARYGPGPTEGGDVVHSLVLTSELNCFLAGGREFNLRVQERRRAGRVGVDPCVGGGLAGRGSGRWRLEETQAAHRAASLGATTIVSCGSGHRRLSAQEKHVCRRKRLLPLQLTDEGPDEDGRSRSRRVAGRLPVEGLCCGPLPGPVCTGAAGWCLLLAAIRMVLSAEQPPRDGRDAGVTLTPSHLPSCVSIHAVHVHRAHRKVSHSGDI